MTGFTPADQALGMPIKYPEAAILPLGRGRSSRPAPQVRSASPFHESPGRRACGRSSRLDEVDIFRVTGGRSEMQLEQSSSATQKERPGDDRMVVQLHQGTAQDQVLLDLHVLLPWGLLAPFGDFSRGDHRSGSTATLTATRHR